MVSKATRERIRERIDLIQLVSEYVALQPRGPDDFWGRCPFHEEKRPSFHVRPSKGMFKCFGCSKGGDVFRFVEEIEGIDFKEALKRCAQRANVPLDEVSPEERARDDKRAELMRALNQTAEFFTDVLWSNTPAGAKGRATLAARGVTEATAKAWRLGMAPEGWGALHQAARERKISEQALLELGLLRKKEQGTSGRPYDFFRDRLMFPICDDQGRVVAFGGRTLSDDERKYMNSPEVAGIYEKRRVLYGLDKAKKAPKPTEGPRRLVVVEGYLDVVIPHQAGLNTFVASLGTAFTLEQAKLARRFFDEAVLLFDGDAAGQAATQRALAALVGASDLTFKVARLPDGFDPDDLVRKDLPALERCLAQADDLVGFLVAETLRGWDAASPQGRERAIKASVRLLARIESELLQTTELNVVAHRFGIPEQLLRDEIIKAKRLEQTPATQPGARDARRPGDVEGQARRGRARRRERAPRGPPRAPRRHDPRRSGRPHRRHLRGGAAPRARERALRPRRRAGQHVGERAGHRRARARRGAGRPGARRRAHRAHRRLEGLRAGARQHRRPPAARPAAPPAGGPARAAHDQGHGATGWLARREQAPARCDRRPLTDHREGALRRPRP